MNIKQADNPSNTPHDYDDMSLYLVSSLVNHSCVPNTNRQFLGEYVFMRAIRDIKKSEEILISYFSADFTLAQRKKNLAAF
jgi:SET domain-containing protein